MRNYDSAYFFRKKIFIKALKSEVITNAIDDSVILTKPKLDIQFFPEGGYLVNGLTNRVGFKVIDINGKGIDVEGEVTDEAGNKILNLKTSKFGMGMFEILPKLDSSYKFNIIYNGEQLVYELPTAIRHGAILQVVEHSKDFVVTLQSSQYGGLNNFNFTAIQRDGVVFMAKIESDKNLAIIKVPKDILVQGIIQFTLLDASNKPLRERLSFYEIKDENINVNIKPHKQEYGTRELVKLDVYLDPKIKKNIKANMSIAITDMSAIALEEYELDI